MCFCVLLSACLVLGTSCSWDSVNWSLAVWCQLSPSPCLVECYCEAAQAGTEGDRFLRAVRVFGQLLPAQTPSKIRELGRLFSRGFRVPTASSGCRNVLTQGLAVIWKCNSGACFELLMLEPVLCSPIGTMGRETRSQGEPWVLHGNSVGVVS